MKKSTKHLPRESLGDSYNSGSAQIQQKAFEMQKALQFYPIICTKKQSFKIRFCQKYQKRRSLLPISASNSLCLSPVVGYIYAHLGRKRVIVERMIKFMKQKNNIILPKSAQILDSVSEKDPNRGLC